MQFLRRQISYEYSSLASALERLLPRPWGQKHLHVASLRAISLYLIVTHLHTIIVRQFFRAQYEENAVCAVDCAYYGTRHNGVLFGPIHIE